MKSESSGPSAHQEQTPPAQPAAGRPPGLRVSTVMRLQRQGHVPPGPSASALTAHLSPETEGKMEMHSQMGPSPRRDPSVQMGKGSWGTLRPRPCWIPCCFNKAPPTRWLRTAIYSLSVLEASSLKSSCQEGHAPPGDCGRTLPCLFPASGSVLARSLVSLGL